MLNYDVLSRRPMDFRSFTGLEVPEFDAAVANNELVAPPAGAIGRGDAFVLGIADKVSFVNGVSACARPRPARGSRGRR